MNRRPNTPDPAATAKVAGHPIHPMLIYFPIAFLVGTLLADIAYAVDGDPGFAQGAPYAGIIAAAGGEAMPTHWTDQLAEGGRIVAPLVGAGGRQALVVVEKAAGRLNQSVLEAVHFVPLKSGIA